MKPIVLLLLLLTASPAFASDICNDLWFSRNAVMDRAGYCFGSPLGQAVFDNRDCTGKSVTISASNQRVVADLQRAERRLGCKVNTKARRLQLYDLSIRRHLMDQPVRDEFESACLGWIGPVIPLRAGTDARRPVIGAIQPGDYVSYAHIPRQGWTYVTVTDGNRRLKSGGWLDLAVPEQCAQFAG